MIRSWLVGNAAKSLQLILKKIGTADIKVPRPRKYSRKWPEIKELLTLSFMMGPIARTWIHRSLCAHKNIEALIVHHMAGKLAGEHADKAQIVPAMGEFYDEVAMVADNGMAIDLHLVFRCCLQQQGVNKPTVSCRQKRIRTHRPARANDHMEGLPG